MVLKFNVHFEYVNSQNTQRLSMPYRLEKASAQSIPWARGHITTGSVSLGRPPSPHATSRPSLTSTRYWSASLPPSRETGRRWCPCWRRPWHCARDREPPWRRDPRCTGETRGWAVPLHGAETALNPEDGHEPPRHSDVESTSFGRTLAECSATRPQPEEGGSRDSPDMAYPLS